MRSVEIKPAALLFPHTYIFSESLYTITIRSSNKQIVNYEWRRFASEEEEQAAIGDYDLSNADQRDEYLKSLAFQSNNFAFSPKAAELWPEIDSEVVVKYTPSLATPVCETAYLFIKETGERIPYLIRGAGLAPDARFKTDTINVGHVDLDSILEYEVVLENIGQVEADFHLVPKEVAGLVFEFSPSEGHIPIGDSVTISIRFIANLVGSFHETFQFHVDGAVEMQPKMTLYGKVNGPVFSLSQKVLDFGTVSYGFLETRTFELVNKSNIGFDYELRLDQVGNFNHREFRVSPSSGTLLGGEKQEILVEFIPISLKSYEVEMFLDINKFGNNMGKVTIIGKGTCPEIRLESEVIDMGYVFVGNPYQIAVNLLNSTPYPTKYEFIPNTDQSVLTASVVCSKPNGIVGPEKITEMKLQVAPQILGPISIIQSIKIIGADYPPLKYEIRAVSTGPKVVLDRQVVDFGTIEVLRDSKRHLTMKNDSLIPAGFKFKVEGEGSLFRAVPEEGMLLPEEQKVIDVIANLDDTLTYHSKLILTVQNNSQVVIPLKATGSGTPIKASIPMDVIDFGFIFSQTSIRSQLSLKNHGRRPQEIRWSNQKPKLDSPNALFGFSVQPEHVIIQPHQTVEFDLIVNCSKPASFSVIAQCHATVARKRSELFAPMVQGTFVTPLLDFSVRQIEFKHVHDPQREEEISRENRDVSPAKELLMTITKDFHIGNQSPLDLDVHVDCPEPFFVPETQFMLRNGELRVIPITFDPTFKTDFITETIHKQMVISCEGHPSKMNIGLIGTVMFPNVTFSPGKDVDFGVLLMNTEETKDVVVKNTSELPVDMVWEMLCPDNQGESTKLFDVYPIRYHIDPDEEMTIRFSFFAQRGEDLESCSYSATAICHIVGGPDYTLNLRGSSAAIQYRIDPLHIDFGSVHYQEELVRKITLQNLSDVPINYSMLIPKGVKFQSVTFSPMSATVPVDGMQVISMKVLPGLPIKYQETVLIQIGHFDDVGVEISADCHIPQVQMDVPHAENDPLLQAYAEERAGDKEREPPTADELSKLECKLLVEKLTAKTPRSGEVVSPAKKRRQDPNVYDGPVASVYDVDMGRIIFGMVETKEVKFKSISPFPVDVEVKAGVLTDTGFSVTPVQFTGVPTGEELTMTFTFDVERKMNDSIGDVEYVVPVVFGQCVAYEVRVRAHLSFPKLNFSKKHFDFESVVVGHTKIITLQLQNMNYVPCEFTFDDAVPMKQGDGEALAVYHATPSHGTLPPSSFLNIEIAFEPQGDQIYWMQFPVHIRHNPRTYHVKVKGEGVQLKLIFDPPRLVMPSVNPLSDPSETELTVSNPTDYPVEFMSQQFDMKLFVDQVTREMTKDKEQPESNADGELITMSSANNTVSKFATCVIVNGPAKSGKSTVSKEISKFMGGVPIVSLRDVWWDLLSQEQIPEPQEYVNALRELISGSEYLEGFVVDGLDVLPDTPETAPFITKCVKQKRVDKDLEENPFMIFPHNEMLSNEQALNYVLAALNGHYVFHVALKVTEQVAFQRIERIELEKRQQDKRAKHMAKQAMFNMSEEQYLELTEEEREDVDRRRAESRSKKLRKAIEEDEERALTANRKSRDRSKSVKSRGRGRTASTKSPQESAREKKTRLRRESERKTERAETSLESARKASRKPNDPANAVRFGILRFNFTLGSVAKQVSEESETFKVVDPVELLHVSPPESARELDSERANHYEEEDQFVTHTNFIREEETHSSAIAIQQKNTLFIKSMASQEETFAEIQKFLPTKKQLEEKAFTKLIPAPYLVIPDLLKEKNIKLLPMPTYFKIVVADEDEPQIERVSVMRPDSHKAKAGRKSRNTRKPKSEEIEIDTTGRTPRWRIEPQSSIKLILRFSPQLIGEYKENLFFIVMNGKTDRFKLVATGVCAHPEIDRDLRVMFPKVIKRADMKQAPAFVTDLNEFQFGPVLVTKEKPKGQGVYRHPIHLTNTSSFPVRATISINEKSLWVLEQTNVTIPPNESSDVFFGINPAAVGVYKAQILILVADNPDPFSFNISAEGCLPSVEVDHDHLDFDRLLLRQSKTLKLEVKNSGKLGVFWHFKGAQQLGEYFKFSVTEGVIPPGQASTVDIAYSSSKAVSVKKAISVDVMDLDKTKMFSSIPVQITAESFACSFDFAYPKGHDHLDFGSLKVGQTKSLVCMFKNKGKYSALFQFASQSPYVTISPDKGTAQSGKDVQITFKFMAPKLAKISNEKAALLTVTDSLTNTQTGTFQVVFSAVTAYSQFVISPEKRSLGFGPVQVLITKTQHFTIQNTGLFAFDYAVGVEPVIPQGEPQSPHGKPKTSQKKSTARGRARKGTEKSTTCGPFTIVPCEGTVHPGSTTTIDVDFCGTTPGKVCETALISISGCNPKIVSSGIPIKFKARAIVPGIITRDFSTILSGTPVKMRYQLAKVDQTSFVEDEGILHFAPLILQKRQSVPIILMNPMEISCIVDVAVAPKDKQANKSGFPFDVSQKVIELEPNERKSVDLIFVPVTCETVVAEFTATVRAGTNDDTNLLRLQVEGTGTLPLISVVNTSDNKSKTGSISVNLGRTLVGFNKEKMVAIRNDGVVDARLNITAKPVTDFELKGFGTATESILEPGRLLNLPVLFTPQAARTAKFDVMVTPLDNPKASFTVSFVAESYVEDVIFEGLQDDDNDIIFKDCIVGRQQESSFRMHNISQNDIRFMWPLHPDIKFTPRMGHIHAGQTKTITVGFFSEKPVRVFGAKYSCQWCKIDLENPASPDWDDTMKVVRYVPKSSLQPKTSDGSRASTSYGRSSSKPTSRRSQRSIGKESPPPPPPPPPPEEDEIVRVTEIQPEPSYSVQPGKFKDLQLKIAVVSDFVKYTLDTELIDFAPTMMYQTRTYEVKMSNPSTIRLNYHWRVAEFVAMRTNYASIRPAPFKVEPASGVIEAGQATTFKVKFQPEEVDEFVAKLKCEIPFLHTSQPPVINVNAISKRPLCHFCVDPSNYISAGRRLPEYQYELPSNIKVIEIYAGGVGQRAAKRFEIINPTSSPYEIEWVKKMPENSDAIACDTPRALVSSGRRYTITFTFTPESVKTVEFLWEFRIPEHQTSIPFLTVGRIVPK